MPWQPKAQMASTCSAASVGVTILSGPCCQLQRLPRARAYRCIPRLSEFSLCAGKAKSSRTESGGRRRSGDGRAGTEGGTSGSKQGSPSIVDTAMEDLHEIASDGHATVSSPNSRYVLSSSLHTLPRITLPELYTQTDGDVDSCRACHKSSASSILELQPSGQLGTTRLQSLNARVSVCRQRRGERKHSSGGEGTKRVTTSSSPQSADLPRKSPGT